MIIMAVDPGPHAGMAAKVNDKYVTVTYTNIDDLWYAIKDFHPAHLAFETFSRTERIDVNMIRTMEMVGGLKAACVLLDMVAHPQQPQERRSFIPDAVELFTDIWGHKPVLTKDKDDHEIQALAHLLRLENKLNG